MIAGILWSLTHHGSLPNRPVNPYNSIYIPVDESGHRESIPPREPPSPSYLAPQAARLNTVSLSFFSASIGLRLHPSFPPPACQRVVRTTRC